MFPDLRDSSNDFNIVDWLSIMSDFWWAAVAPTMFARRKHSKAGVDLVLPEWLLDAANLSLMWNKWSFECVRKKFRGAYIFDVGQVTQQVERCRLCA